MGAEYAVAEQIVRLLHGPHGAIWELVEPRGADAPTGGPGRTSAADVAIRGADGQLVALARPTEA